MRHLEGLNDMQKRAATHTRGPLLIIAGAGAGKTKTITHRILHLVRAENVSPSSILAVTFTNKAAHEMRSRISALLRAEDAKHFLGLEGDMPFVSTFHSLCVHILRAEHERIGLPKSFSIFDESDSLSLVKEALRTCGLDPKQFDPRRIRAVISRKKGELLSPDAYEEKEGGEYFPKVAASVWRAYEKLLSENKAADFDDLLVKTVSLLEAHPDIADAYRKRWRYIHIDEYQDTNTAQYRLSVLLAGKEKNICVVGDMDQSIYSWRGADFRNILNFERDFPEAETILLEENYRSTATILAAANAVIAKNTIRKEKNLFTKKGAGERIGVFGAYTEAEEAAFVAEKSAALIAAGAAPEDIAVLYRANFQSRALEEAFLAKGVPYRVLGVRFFDRKEVKDLLSFLRASLNPESMPDFKRAAENPPRGIGKATLAKVFAKDENTLPARAKEKLRVFRDSLRETAEAIGKRKASEAVRFALAASGLEAHHKKGGDEGSERIENMRELVSFAARYDTLPPGEGVAKLLEDAALASDQDALISGGGKERVGVSLMTVHAAKGLEFPYVFVTGLEDELFPHAGFSPDTAAAREREEEERRLFYVAVTRAEKKLFLTYASVRTIFGSKKITVPSEYLSDIDQALLEDARMDSLSENEEGIII